jgi:hypothetical protein
MVSSGDANSGYGADTFANASRGEMVKLRLRVSSRTQQDDESMDGRFARWQVHGSAVTPLAKTFDPSPYDDLPTGILSAAMGLSDTRNKKQRIADDPRNTAWASNTEGKGYQLLAKMGWSGDAKGLTAAAPPPAKIFSRIPVAKEDNLGIGASKINTGALFSALGTKAFHFVSGGNKEQQRHLQTEGSDFSSLLARLNTAQSTPQTSREGSAAVEVKTQAVNRNA